MLRNKRVLITAGPTWVAIDKVRVISNTASGETGILLAQELARSGAKPTLLLGPVTSCCLNKKIRVVNFKFFDELKNALHKELLSKKFDAVIHTAAVSDFKPAKTYAVKLSSGLKNLRINLIPSEKIIDSIKKISPRILAVGFKFEPDVKGNALIKKADLLLKKARLDLVVANTAYENKYRAYIVNKQSSSKAIGSKNILAAKLVKILDKLL